MSETKQAFIIKTAAHARHLLAQAEARVARFSAELAGAQAQVAEYQNLAATLPEGAAPANRPEVPLGTVVQFQFGREDKRVTLTGTVVAEKRNEDGRVSQYKVQVGTGFEAEFKTVYPGSILVNGVAEPEAQDSDDPLAA